MVGQAVQGLGNLQVNVAGRDRAALIQLYEPFSLQLPTSPILMLIVFFSVINMRNNVRNILSLTIEEYFH